MILANRRKPMSNRLCERPQRKILRIRVPSQILERWMPAFGSKGDVRLSSSDVCCYPNIRRRSARDHLLGNCGRPGRPSVQWSRATLCGPLAGNLIFLANTVNRWISARQQRFHRRLSPPYGDNLRSGVCMAFSAVLNCCLADWFERAIDWY